MNCRLLVSGWGLSDVCIRPQGGCVWLGIQRAAVLGAGYWGLGTGEWGLRSGDWGLSASARTRCCAFVLVALVECLLSITYRGYLQCTRSCVALTLYWTRSSVSLLQLDAQQRVPTTDVAERRTSHIAHRPSPLAPRPSPLAQYPSTSPCSKLCETGR